MLKTRKVQLIGPTVVHKLIAKVRVFSDNRSSKMHGCGDLFTTLSSTAKKLTLQKDVYGQGRIAELDHLNQVENSYLFSGVKIGDQFCVYKTKTLYYRSS